MKNIVYVLILLTSIGSIGSCNENEPKINNIFQITIADKWDDCGLLLIDFAESDRIRIEEITETTGWLRFFAFNLDLKYNQVGKVLEVKVRRTKDEELYACTTQGPAYPWVKVLTKIAF